jgi:hypothetical protein
MDRSNEGGKGAGNGGMAGKRLAVRIAIGRKVNVAAMERLWKRDKPHSMCPLQRMSVWTMVLILRLT